jgi:hypothetical protein
MSANREALIIATGKYDSPELRLLRAPAQDADQLAPVLADSAVGDFNVRPLLLDQPSEVIRRAVERFFSKRVPDDVLLVHISCHGVKDDDGRLFFAASNTELEFLSSTTLEATFLHDQMERCRARSIVLLLDCCYSGAFFKGSKGDRSLHLKEKLAGQGHAVMTASNALEYAWEGNTRSGLGEASIFTAAIIEGLKTGKADRDQDGKVSVSDLHGYVCDRVAEGGKKQTPMLWALAVRDNLYIARNPRPSRGTAPRSILTVLKRRRLTEAGLVELLRQHRSRWTEMAKKSFRYTQEFETPDDRMTPVDAAILVVAHLEVDSLFRTHLVKRRLRQKYWYTWFAELIVDELWDEIQ